MFVPKVRAPRLTCIDISTHVTKLDRAAKTNQNRQAYTGATANTRYW